jgi:hypothetical protein
MPAPITAPTITATAVTAPTKHPQASTATITNKSSRASLQLTHELEGYIRRMRSRTPTENVKSTNNTKIHPTEPERDSSTPSQAWGLLTRARIRAPLTAILLPLKTTRHSNTIDNVKAKIENIKAKIQDKEERRPWSRPSLARRLVFGQLAASPTSFPLEEPPRQVSTSHDKSPPHTTSLRLA